jgi:SAM-dependent methyltransferase
MGHKFDPRNVARLDHPDRLGYEPPGDVLGLLALAGDETVVDYGAGVGYATLPLAVDRSAELLDELRRRLAASAANGGVGGAGPVELFLTTDNRVPLPDGAADAIVALNLWHEIYDEQPALDELRRLLAPGGTLAIVDWAPVERPVGPPGEHVLTLDQALAVTDAMDLVADAVHPAGTLFAYHYAIVARPRG